jgi:hypothetical protein
MQLKRYKEFNEGIFSKVKNAFKTEFQIGVDHIRNILKENPLVSDLKEIPKSGKEFIWKFKLKEEFPFEIELKLPFKMFVIYFTHIESINRYGDNGFTTLERLVEDSGYYINIIMSKYTKFEEEKRDFELDYPIADIKNWTHDIKDFDGVEDFEIREIEYGDDRPNSKSLNWVLDWQSKPGYLLRFILNKEDSDEINKILDELGKRLENNGLKIEKFNRRGEISTLRSSGDLYYFKINKIYNET